MLVAEHNKCKSDLPIHMIRGTYRAPLSREGSRQMARPSPVCGMTLVVDPALSVTNIRKLADDIRGHAQDHLAA